MAGSLPEAIEARPGDTPQVMTANVFVTPDSQAAQGRQMPSPYGKAHQAQRRRLLASLPAPCGRCGVLIPYGIESSLVQLDHVGLAARDGGQGGEGTLSHRLCNEADGARVTNERRRQASAEHQAALTRRDEAGRGKNPTTGAGFLPSGARTSRAVSSARTEPSGEAAQALSTPAEAAGSSLLASDLVRAVLEQPWIKSLGGPPTDVRLPRVMTGPHPRAFGSFGAKLIEAARDRRGIDLRYWQAFALSRILEHDIDGELVWDEALLSTARQVGKSTGLRELAMFRLEHPELFGPDLVMSLATSLRVAAELQRPAATWADRQGGHKTFHGSNYVAIERLADDRRWIVAAASASHSYTVGLMAVDEVWGVPAKLIEDHAEPTLLAASHPQLLLTSTAHPEATSLFLDRRRAAIAELAEPTTRLILEWSAPPDSTELDDVELWRQASPEWTSQRERLMRKAFASAAAKRDLASFRAQYLNIWPRPGEVAERNPMLIDPNAYLSAQGAGPVGLNWPVLALEDSFTGGGALVLAELDGELVRVTGELFADRAEAYRRAGWLLDRAGGAGRFLFGASLTDEAELDEVPVSPEARGGVETRRGLAVFASLMRQRRIVFDRDAADLARLMLAARTATTSTGPTLSLDFGRVDAVRAVVWAIAAAVADGQFGEGPSL